jgi:hypothetical protein
MKTQHENLSDSNSQEKDKLINSIAEVLKKHCTSRYDVECFINSVTASSEFIEELQAHRHDIVFKIRSIEEVLKSHGTDKDLTVFKEISEIFISGLILSGHLKEGNHLIYQMDDDLQAVI